MIIELKKKIGVIPRKMKQDKEKHYLMKNV